MRESDRLATLRAPLVSDDPAFPSGRWTGYYMQAGIRFRQDLDLDFTDGVMRGGGIDSVGAFTVAGNYCVESHEVTWVKSYTGGHDVDYRGFREGRGIWGTWRLDRYRGGFHIWPRGEQAADVDRLAVEEEEGVTVGAPTGCEGDGPSPDTASGAD